MSDKITIHAGWQNVEADAGMTIWEVANGRGLVIPHLCHKPRPAIALTVTAAPVWSRSKASESGRVVYP